MKKINSWCIIGIKGGWDAVMLKRKIEQELIKKNKLQSGLAKFFWNIEFNMWDPPGKHWIYLNSTLKTLILGFRLATKSRLMGRRHLYISL